MKSECCNVCLECQGFIAAEGTGTGPIRQLGVGQLSDLQKKTPMLAELKTMARRNQERPA
jgi:hypothetical protein